MVFSLVWSIISLKAPAEKWSSFHSSGRSTGTATLCSPGHGRPRKDWGHWPCWPQTSSSSTSLLQVCPTSWVFSTEHKVLTLPRTRNILVLQVTALESNKILRQLIQISHCSQKLGSQKQCRECSGEGWWCLAAPSLGAGTAEQELGKSEMGKLQRTGPCSGQHLW